MKKTPAFFILLIAVLSFLIFGCASIEYFPIKNSVYFDNSPSRKNVVLMPFRVDAVTIISAFNTYEQLHEKSEEAEDFVYRGFKEVLMDKNYSIVDYISADNLEKDDFDEDTKQIIEELQAELLAAKYTISKNLKDDYGKKADYSIGIRVKELKERLKEAPDLFLFVLPGGFIERPTALEVSGGNAALAVLTLGMSALMPVPDDTLYIEAILVDANTGQIVWDNHSFSLSQSLLIYDHVKNAIKTTLLKLPNG